MSPRNDRPRDFSPIMVVFMAVLLTVDALAWLTFGDDAISFLCRSAVVVAVLGILAVILFRKGL